MYICNFSLCNNRLQGRRTAPLGVPLRQTWWAGGGGGGSPSAGITHANPTLRVCVCCCTSRTATYKLGVAQENSSCPFRGGAVPTAAGPGAAGPRVREASRTGSRVGPARVRAWLPGGPPAAPPARAPGFLSPTFEEQVALSACVIQNLSPPNSVHVGHGLYHRNLSWTRTAHHGAASLTRSL